MSHSEGLTPEALRERMDQTSLPQFGNMVEAGRDRDAASVAGLSRETLAERLAEGHLAFRDTHEFSLQPPPDRAPPEPDPGMVTMSMPVGGRLRYIYIPTQHVRRSRGSASFDSDDGVQQVFGQ